MAPVRPTSASAVTTRPAAPDLSADIASAKQKIIISAAAITPKAAGALQRAISRGVNVVIVGEASAGKVHGLVKTLKEAGAHATFPSVVDAVNGASRRIVVSPPVSSITPDIRHALRAAEARGVEVVESPQSSQASAALIDPSAHDAAQLLPGVTVDRH